MNETMQTILKRRSIRKYRPTAVSRADIEMILEAALYAPTGADAEPWHFTVITDKEVIDELDERARKAMGESGIERIMAMGNHPKYRVFFHAPVVILISGEKVLNKTGTHLSALADCSAAIQNMQLAATSLGLGTCWIGLVRYLFEKDHSMAPDGYTPFFAMTLGISSGPDTVQVRERRTGTVTWIEPK